MATIRCLPVLQRIYRTRTSASFPMHLHRIWQPLFFATSSVSPRLISIPPGWDATGDAEQRWLGWSERLREALNRQLFLGLFTFESHFAHYAPGDFYRQHLDAFKADALTRKANRKVSVVAYFNPGWLPDDGGELVIYDAAGTGSLLRVTPAYGSLVVFMSEDVPHEVLPARRDRYSIAGWFRTA